MSSPKDTQVAMSIQQMAAYGYFKEEFLYYGYAFQRGKQIIYRLSENRLSLYTHYHQSIFEDILPTPIHDLLKNIVVPAGEQQRFRLQIKIELIQKLRSLYNEAYYEAVQLLQGTKPTNSAEPLLEAYLHGHLLQGETRQLFNGVCQLALEAKLLHPNHYRTLIQTANRLYGEPQPVSKPLDGRGKTFSGFAYGTADMLRFYTSATLEDTYYKYHQLVDQGTLCTPILQRSYWYDSPNDYKQARAAFVGFLQGLTAECAIFPLIAELKALPPAVNVTHYQLTLDQLLDQGTVEAIEALTSYGYRFNITPLDN